MPDFSTLILKWYRQNKRNLPWRDSNDPYIIWISEVILQQTRIDQGFSYFIKFQKQYPNVHKLAAASEDEVLRLWQGLGYYSRARNMHSAAKRIVSEHEGSFPSTFDQIRSLKGVGDYTASAIASIAFNLPHAVVDGNVYRFLSRYLAIKTPIDSTAGKKEFKTAAQLLLDQNDPGTHNQAMMEMGSLICTVSNPKCDECPVGDSCLSSAVNEQLNYPVKTKKTKVVNRNLHYLVITDGESLLLKKRGTNGIWAGLYDFPELEYETNINPKKEDIKKWNLKTIDLDGSFTHILSHQKIQANFWLAKVDQIQKSNDSEQKIRIDHLDDFPMPQLLIRYLQSASIFEAD